MSGNEVDQYNILHDRGDRRWETNFEKHSAVDHQTCVQPISSGYVPSATIGTFKKSVPEIKWLSEQEPQSHGGNVW